MLPTSKRPITRTVSSAQGCDLIIEAIASAWTGSTTCTRGRRVHRAGRDLRFEYVGAVHCGTCRRVRRRIEARFCGVHFFNPPRYMHLVELNPTAATRAEILDQLEGFLTTTLGKGVVRAKDTPNFIANGWGLRHFGNHA